jgi:hypothetical protein
MNEKNWLFKKVSLPHVPEYLIEMASEESAPGIGDQGGIYSTPYQLDGWKGQSYAAPRIVRKSFDERFTEWVKENITENFQIAGIMVCEGTPDTPSTGAHSDLTRDFALIYTATPGGDHTDISFWKEENNPVWRGRGVRVSDFSSLEFVESFPTPVRHWYLLNVGVLHSVENLSGKRVNFQVSFEGELPEEIQNLLTS